MPEGPQCKLTSIRLHTQLSGRLLQNITILGGRYNKCGPPSGLPELVHILQNEKVRIDRIGGKGKLIYFVLSNGNVILNTLGLSGGWTHICQKHCDVEFAYSDTKRIWFKDQLHYGTLKVTNMEGLTSKLSQLGPDIVLGRSELSLDHWRTICAKHKTWQVTKLLMSQNKISGIGNYLKAEILYAARIAPECTIKEIPEDALIRLHEQIVGIPNRVLTGKLRNRGDTGCYVMKVYGKKKDSRGNPVVRTKTADGRVSHWVPAVQQQFWSSSLDG